MMAFNPPYGKVNYRENFPHDPVEDHFRNHFIPFKKQLGITLGFLLDPLQGNFERKEKLPLFQRFPVQGQNPKDLGANS
jgi:hypothetical protein